MLKSAENWLSGFFGLDWCVHVRIAASHELVGKLTADPKPPHSQGVKMLP
jgi:hypothetical protein